MAPNQQLVAPNLRETCDRPIPSPGADRTPVPRRVALYPLQCAACGTPQEAAALAICGQCLGPLEIAYPTRKLPTRAAIERRPRSLWRYAEWLPLTSAPRLATHAGWTPLADAPALARTLGVKHVALKLDACSTSSLSFKDRVVATAINAAVELGLEAVACASTGNLANAVAAAAARAGLPAWIFVPEDIEPAKLAATAAFGAHLVRVRGNYDAVNRLCAQLADRLPWGFVNVNLRPYYGEGSKTMAFEIIEQLGWQLPTAVVAPMAGGSLVTKLEKGFREFREAGLVTGETPRIYGAQAAGCAPIVRLFEAGPGAPLVPEVPQTIARSLAIGNPADGHAAAQVLRISSGGAAAVSDADVVDGIRSLARLAGVFGETAAGVTVAGALALAARGAFHPSDRLVLCITGHGLKTSDVVAHDVEASPVVNPKVREVLALTSEPTSPLA